MGAISPDGFEPKIGRKPHTNHHDQIQKHNRHIVFVRHLCAIVIENIEDERRMIFYTRKRGSSWINTFAKAERWLNEQENARLSLENIERPNTKWVFVKFYNVEVKVVFDRQPLR